MILVTGGAGFIGSNIVAGLADRGVPVAVCDHFGHGDKWKNLRRHEVADLITPDALMAWLDRHGGRLTAVVHLGAISATTETDVDLIVAANFRLSLDLWEWCAYRRVPFIYASSAATYGDGEAGFADDASPQALARLKPLNPYGWSKLATDRRFVRLVDSGGPVPPQWVGLKFFNVYGPNEYHKGDMRSVIAKNYETIAAGNPLRLFKSYRPDYADGGQKRDFVYVRDCVDIIVWLIGHPKVSGIFNIGSGRARSWLELGEAMFRAVGRAPAIEFIEMPETLRPKYQYFTEAPIDRLRAAGYDRPMTTLEDGIADYVQRYLATDDPYR
ncbi:MAG: ADP-glyceromanno-heptose 6-epimerase [Ferrovibrionaceae bacterium]